MAFEDILFAVNTIPGSHKREPLVPPLPNPFLLQVVAFSGRPRSISDAFILSVDRSNRSKQCEDLELLAIAYTDNSNSVDAFVK